MYLTPELEEKGRYNFWNAVAGAPALEALSGKVAKQGPRRGGPVKIALIGAGGEGKLLLSVFEKGWADLRAICDINPKHASAAADGMAEKGWNKPRIYQDWKQMLEKEDLEAVVIATPLWTHADITAGCLDAGKHVLCEKMMAWDVDGCQRMMAAARKNKRVLEIGYQRFWSPIYQAAYDRIGSTGILGDIHYARMIWHRNKSWKREEAPPSKDFDPRAWGYDSWEHLVNWRLYNKYSRGLLAELGSHQVSIVNWFFGSMPTAVYTTGGVHRWKYEREVMDHVYATFEYPGDRTALFTSIESNAFEDTYEEINGTKGTLLFRGSHGYLFYEDADKEKLEAATGPGKPPEGFSMEGRLAYRNEVAGFCAAIRQGTPLMCGPEKAFGSAASCIRAQQAGSEKTRLTLDVAQPKDAPSGPKHADGVGGKAAWDKSHATVAR